MIFLFRVISFLEGLSFVLLLFFAMPMKYFGQQDIFVKLLGMPHGILFLIYIFYSLLLAFRLKWGFRSTLEILLASVIPFGTFYVDHKYLKNSSYL